MRFAYPQSQLGLRPSLKGVPAGCPPTSPPFQSSPFLGCACISAAVWHCLCSCLSRARAGMSRLFWQPCQGFQSSKNVIFIVSVHLGAIEVVANSCSYLAINVKEED